MDILKNSLQALFLTLVSSALLAPIMINLLYKFNQVSGIKKSKIGGGDGDNTLFMKIMKSTTTNGTPNMGGVLVWVVVPIMTLFLVPVTPVIKKYRRPHIKTQPKICGSKAVFGAGGSPQTKRSIENNTQKVNE